MSRALKLACALAALSLLLTSCRIEMGVGAKLNADGSGTFTLALALDKEFIEGLSGSSAAKNLGGIKGFEDLFNGLRSMGWKVTRDDAGGGVAFRGACGFRDQAGFGKCIGQLGSSDSGTKGLSFKDAGLAFDLGSKRGFFRSHTFFTGHVNLQGPLAGRTEQFKAQLQALSSQVFAFDVRAELPGSVRIVQGAGSVDGNTATWSPKLGEVLDLRAESDAYNPVAIFAVGFPVILLLMGGIFLLVRKRPEHDDSGFAAPDAFQVGALQNDAVPTDADALDVSLSDPT